MCLFILFLLGVYRQLCLTASKPRRWVPLSSYHDPFVAVSSGAQNGAGECRSSGGSCGYCGPWQPTPSIRKEPGKICLVVLFSRKHSPSSQADHLLLLVGYHLYQFTLLPYSPLPPMPHGFPVAGTCLSHLYVISNQLSTWHMCGVGS